jgi:nucleoid DNA-binding protein
MSKKIKKVKQVAKKDNNKKEQKCTKVVGPVKVSKPFNKSQIAGTISERICISKKEAGHALDTLFEIISAHLKKRSGPGEFTLPGVAKFKVINKPATKARQGVNPFTGESMMFAAKPARNVVKVRALKKIKDIAK